MDRLMELQCAHWEELSVVRYWLCKDDFAARRLETNAHSVLAEQRIRGEWFGISSGIAADVVMEMAAELKIELKEISSLRLRNVAGLT